MRRDRLGAGDQGLDEMGGWCGMFVGGVWDVGCGYVDDIGRGGQNREWGWVDREIFSMRF